MEGSRKPLAKVEGRRRLRLSGVTVAWRGTPNLDDWVAYIVNGIWATSGSLGHGLPIALGMAKARKILRQSGRIYVILGDGELQEGTLWEAMLLARQHRRDLAF